MKYILLAEDNVGDVMLVQEALAAHHVENMLHVVKDGQEALDFVSAMGEGPDVPCPDLMLLDEPAKSRRSHCPGCFSGT